MAALGSSHMFSDQYLDKEENGKIMVSFCCCSFKEVFLVAIHGTYKAIQAH